MQDRREFLFQSSLAVGALPLPLRGPSLLRFSEPSAYGDAAAVTPPGEDDPGSRCLNGYRYDELRPRSAVEATIGKTRFRTPVRFAVTTVSPESQETQGQ
jgi:hypothetical protein